MTLDIHILNTTSTINNVIRAHEIVLDHELSFWSDGAQFSIPYRKGLWDGRRHLYKCATAKNPFGKFPTGLVSRVIGLMESHFPKESINVLDERQRPEAQQPLPLVGVELYDYQKEAVEKALTCTRGLFRLATGGGKSLVECAIMAYLNVPTLVMSHRTDILDHLQGEVERFMGIKVNRIQGKKRSVGKFNLAMIQTVTSCFDNCVTNKEAGDVVNFIQNECQCLILDESHHSQSKSYALLTNRAYNAYYRLGFSATMSFGDPEDMAVEAGFGKLQMIVTPSDLIKQKKLSKPYIFFIDYGDESGDKDEVNKCQACGGTSLTPIERVVGKKKAKKKTVEQDVVGIVTEGLLDLTTTVYKCDDCRKEWSIYTDATVRCLIKNDKRNETIVNLAVERIRKNNTCLILVNYVEHGQELYNRLKTLVNVDLIEFAHGQTEHRKELLEQLRKKEKLCIISTNIFGEGINLPNLSCIILARASFSAIDVLQSVGRALRRAPGKWKTLVLDLWDKSEYFLKRSKFRMKLLESEPEFKVKRIKYEKT